MGIIDDEHEILDLVDEHERVVGSITHLEAYDPINLHGHYLRAANAFIVNTKGKLWIPKRTTHKKIAPGGLDYSAGEHAQAGESYLHTIVRGFAEELNIMTDEKSFFYAGKSLPKPGKPPYFAAIYIYFSDETPQYNPDDFVSYEWMMPAALLEKLASGVPAKAMLADDVRLVLAYLAKHQSNQ